MSRSSLALPKPRGPSLVGAGLLSGVLLLSVALAPAVMATAPTGKGPGGSGPSSDPAPEVLIARAPGPHSTSSEAGASPAGAPRHSSAAGSVADTLDLQSGALSAGNSPPPESCFSPTNLVAIPALSEMFVTCGGSNSNIVAVSLSTDAVIASVRVGAGPWGVAYDSGNGDLYVSNYGTGNVSVLDASTDAVVGSVPVDLTPEGVGYDATNGDVYVADDFSNNVSVIDGATNGVIATVPVGNYPVGVAYDTADKQVFVPNRASGNVSVLSGTTNTLVASIPVGAHPSGVCYDSAQDEMFVANSVSDNVSILDGATDSVVATVPVGSDPQGVACDTTDDEVFVTNSASDNVSVISTTSDLVIANVAIGDSALGAAYDAASDQILVADPVADSVSVLTGATPALSSTFVVGESLQGVGYDPANGDVYVADEVENDVVVIDGATNAIAATVPVGAGPMGLAVDSVNGDIYVADSVSNDVSVIDGGTNTVLTTVPVGLDPVAVGVASGNDQVYVANDFSNNVSVLDGGTNSVVGSIPVGSFPAAIAYDPANGEVLVANSGSANLSVLSSTSGRLLSTVSAGSYPVGAAYDGGDGDFYVSDAGSDNVLVLPGNNDSVVQAIPVPSSPQGIGYDGTDGAIFVADGGANEVSVISGRQILGNLSVGVAPLGADFDAATGFGYVSDSGDSALSILSLSATVPTLSGLSVAPAAPEVAVGGSLLLTAVPTCTGGGCPSGTTYVWGLNNSLGSLAPSSGPTDLFTAGSHLGVVNLTLSGTLSSVGSTTWTALVLTPDLTSVSVTPSPGAVSVGGTVSFTAVPVCSPHPCPLTDMSFAWGLNNSRANLTGTYAASVNVTAGLKQGVDDLTLTADLGGLVAQNSVLLAIAPSIFSVTVSPFVSDVPVGGNLNLTATPKCQAGPCPTGGTYLWAVNNSLGAMAPGISATDEFTAGSREGSVIVNVTVELDGDSAKGSASIVIFPVLSLLQVDPSPILVIPGGVQRLVADPECAGGPCPAGASFTWTLGPGLGTLQGGRGATNSFTAVAHATSGSLWVNVSLSGQQVGAVVPVSVSSSYTVLSGVVLDPSLAQVQPGASLTFNATPTCAPSRCPSSLMAYSWSLGSPMGTLSSETASTTTFTAGSVEGQLTLTVTADVYGVSATASAIITISPGVLPTLTGVSLVAGEVVDNTQTFSASATCSPAPCPGIVTYAWSLNSTLGSLSTPTGPSTIFTPGPNPGTVALLLVATLNDMSASNTTNLQVFSATPPLVGVSISPQRVTIAPGASAMFTATAKCSPDPVCPSSVVFAWSTDTTLGSLSSEVGPTTSYTSGNFTGTVILTATATLNGTSLGDSSIITVAVPSSATPTYFGLTAVELLAVGVLVVGTLLTILLIWPRKPLGTRKGASPEPAGSSASEEAATKGTAATSGAPEISPASPPAEPGGSTPPSPSETSGGSTEVPPAEPSSPPLPTPAKPPR